MSLTEGNASSYIFSSHSIFMLLYTLKIDDTLACQFINTV